MRGYANLLVIQILLLLMVPTIAMTAGASDLLPGDSAPGRVSAIEGRLSVRGSYDSTRTGITLNAVVRPGDELSTPAGSFAEIELAGGTFVRMAGGTTAAVDRVDDLWLVVLLSGAVSVVRGSQAPGISVVALGTRVALDRTARVRADLDRDQMRAQVRVTDGRAELVTGADSQLLGQGEVLVHLPGIERRERWDHEDDVFDAWVDRRIDWVDARQPPTHLSSTGAAGSVTHAAYVGIHELEGHGEWVRINGRRGFSPRVGKTWRPYHRGTWSWVAPHGWVWVPRLSWEYVTHHYGRWVHDAEYGWIWIPDPRWGPGWVAWAGFGPYLGWAPLSPAGHAVVINHDYDSLCWVFAELIYFFAGGGVHGHHHHDPVIIILPQVVVTRYVPVPIDSPATDLAPSSGSDDEDERRSRRVLTDLLRRSQGHPLRGMRKKGDSPAASHNRPRLAQRHNSNKAEALVAKSGRSRFDPEMTRRSAPFRRERVTGPKPRPAPRGPTVQTIDTGSHRVAPRVTATGSSPPRPRVHPPAPAPRPGVSQSASDPSVSHRSPARSSPSRPSVSHRSSARSSPSRPSVSRRSPTRSSPARSSVSRRSPTRSSPSRPSVSRRSPTRSSPARSSVSHGSSARSSAPGVSRRSSTPSESVSRKSSPPRSRSSSPPGSSASPRRTRKKQ